MAVIRFVSFLQRDVAPVQRCTRLAGADSERRAGALHDVSGKLRRVVGEALEQCTLRRADHNALVDEERIAKRKSPDRRSPNRKPLESRDATLDDRLRRVAENLRGAPPVAPSSNEFVPTKIRVASGDDGVGALSPLVHW